MKKEICKCGTLVMRMGKLVGEGKKKKKEIGIPKGMTIG